MSNYAFKDQPPAQFSTGSVRPSCDGKTSSPKYRNPPLIFNLHNDPAESTPLVQTTAEYKGALNVIELSLNALNNDITRDNTCYNQSWRRFFTELNVALLNKTELNSSHFVNNNNTKQ